MTRTSRIQNPKRPLFISLRWRFLFPITVVMMVVAMVGSYGLASRITTGFEISEENFLLQNGITVVNRANEQYIRQRSEAQRLAYTTGIAEALIANQVTSLHQSLEAMARVSELDSLIVTDPRGVEVAGVLRVQNMDPVDYSVSTGTDMSTQPSIRLLLDSGLVGGSEIVQTPQGMMVYVAVPINVGDQFVGIALAGNYLQTLLGDIRASAVAHLALYDTDGIVIQTTFPLTTPVLGELRVDPRIVEQTLIEENPVISSILVSDDPYRTVYTPLHYGETILGIAGVLMPDNIPFAAAVGRQMVSLFAAALAGMAVIMGFLLINRYVLRLERISSTAQALTAGRMTARTGMQASDEIGAVGRALDAFANATQRREDTFQSQLRRERRERAYLLSVLETIPDGIVVQDKDGAVLLMNERARQLLGTQEHFKREHLPLEEQIQSALGPALAPGIYALGNPTRIEYDGKMLSAQAAAILTAQKSRIGTVILVRDITAEVQDAHAREILLNQLSEDIHQPLADLGMKGAQQNHQMVNEFAREISRHAAGLQKMIVDMRELTRYSARTSQQMIRPILAETLMVAVANDWRQIAQAAELDLKVIIDSKGHYVLGDESRLRWAIGNVVDNAIKYTPLGGTVTLEIREELDGLLHLRIRDNGVGIAQDDLDNIFMPFYRGTPVKEDGQVIRVPGMGQGLPLARQIVRAHGGVMKVKSRIGVGTAVYLALPVTSGESYELSFLDDDVMEGETVRIPEDYDLESVWKR